MEVLAVKDRKVFPVATGFASPRAEQRGDVRTFEVAVFGSEDHRFNRKAGQSFTCASSFFFTGRDQRPRAGSEPPGLPAEKSGFFEMSAWAVFRIGVVERRFFSSTDNFRAGEVVLKK